ncbi:MAG: TRAP transporter substrate-binding protein [Elainellaceae cyanobacterium]
MATSWPESLDIIFGTAQQICDRVRELTNGNFSITAFPAGGIAPPLEILDTVQTNTVECGHTLGYYYIAKNPAFAFTSGVPFGLTARQHMAWMQSGGLELTRAVYADFNAINFPAGSTGTQMGGWFKRKVQSLDDLKSLKMRIPSLGGEVMKRLGVQVQTLPPSEILTALERNDIDAAEWSTPYDDEKLGLSKIAKYYYYPGWQEPGTTFELIVNQSAWEQLPTEYQQMLQLAASECQATTLAQYDSLNREALQRLVSNGTELTPYSGEILAAAQKAAFDMYEELANQNADFRSIYEQWTAFRNSIYQWDRVGEQSFTNFTFQDS